VILSLPCTAYDRILLCLFLVFLTLFWAFLSFQIHPRRFLTIFRFVVLETSYVPPGLRRLSHMGFDAFSGMIQIRLNLSQLQCEFLCIKFELDGRLRPIFSAASCAVIYLFI